MNRNSHSIFKIIFVTGGAFLILTHAAVLQNSFAAEKSVRILFVGNSLTSVNNLPGMFSDLARSRGHKTETEMYAPGGYQFFQHSSDQKLLNKIKTGGWDFVVLQEQSQLPALSEAQIEKQVYPYAQWLSRYIKGINIQTHVAFYMTMAKKNGDREFSKSIPQLATYNGMQKRLAESYTHMARQNQSTLVPVGLVWQSVRSKNPSIELYADETHPNMIGTYLAACVFYAVLFNDKATGLAHPPGIDDRTARQIQQATDETVSIQMWDYSQLH